MLKSVAVCLALAAAYLLCAGCGGTIRALDNDYDSDAPTVVSIAPLSGVSGEEVTFKAIVCHHAGGAENPQYIWDFGTGAEPNVSYETEPKVVLRDGLRSPYTCKLTIKASCTGEEKNRMGVTNFTISVLPLKVLSVTPSTGVGGGTATFSALLESGVASAYQWDFGGACDPNGSTQANPVVKFVDNGSGNTTLYNCSLVASNAFEANQYMFTIAIQPKPAAT
jgi:PKD repeat protein